MAQIKPDTLVFWESFFHVRFLWLYVLFSSHKINSINYATGILAETSL